jgi:hypothetical protein
MATVHWTGNGSNPGGTKNHPTSGNWNNIGNWSGGALPIAGDIVELGGNSGALGYTVALDLDTPILASLNIKSDGSGLAVLDVAVHTLAVSGTVHVSGPAGNEITIEGGEIDAATITLGAGSILSGFGTLQVTGHYTGSGTLIATGGTLTVDGTVNSSIALQIDSGTPNSDLWIAGTATSSAISISSSNQTLDVAGTLTLHAAESVTNGTISLDGGTLKDAHGLTLEAGGQLIGYGIVKTGPTQSSDTELNNGGSVTASGGQLTFTGAVEQGQKSAGTFNIAGGSTLAFDGAVGSGTAVFLEPAILAAEANVVAPTPETLDLTGEGRGVNGEIAKFDGFVSNFEAGDQILVAGASGDTVSLVGQGTLEVKHGNTLEELISLNGDYTGRTFTLTPSGSIDTITVSGTGTIACFMSGTLVLTPSGEVAVETLKRGDLVVTTAGRSVPVTWVGLQTVSTQFADPLRILPIRIKAGALGDNVPSRDFLLSPDHAVLVDGALIQAGALVNGTSIVRETNVPQVFTYYHVEADYHSLILAENTPAETFVDNIDRLNFDNWAEHRALYPEGKSITELPYPRAKAHRQVPVNIRVKLAERAEMIGAAVADAAVA